MKPQHKQPDADAHLAIPAAFLNADCSAVQSRPFQAKSVGEIRKKFALTWVGIKSVLLPRYTRLQLYAFLAEMVAWSSSTARAVCKAPMPR